MKKSVENNISISSIEKHAQTKAGAACLDRSGLVSTLKYRSVLSTWICHIRSNTHMARQSHCTQNLNSKSKTRMRLCKSYGLQTELLAST